MWQRQQDLSLRKSSMKRMHKMKFKRKRGMKYSKKLWHRKNIGKTETELIIGHKKTLSIYKKKMAFKKKCCVFFDVCKEEC